jgi:hypothetical protein
MRRTLSSGGKLRDHAPCDTNARFLNEKILIFWNTVYGNKKSLSTPHLPTAVSPKFQRLLVVKFYNFCVQ